MRTFSLAIAILALLCVFQMLSKNAVRASNEGAQPRTVVNALGSLRAKELATAYEVNLGPDTTGGGGEVIATLGFDHWFMTTELDLTNLPQTTPNPTSLTIYRDSSISVYIPSVVLIVIPVSQDPNFDADLAKGGLNFSLMPFGDFTSENGFDFQSLFANAPKGWGNGDPALKATVKFTGPHTMSAQGVKANSVTVTFEGFSRSVTANNAKAQYEGVPLYSTLPSVADATGTVPVSGTDAAVEFGSPSVGYCQADNMDVTGTASVAGKTIKSLKVGGKPIKSQSIKVSVSGANTVP
ncbi:MAG TPA: hypothetical protein VKX17_17290 [Planctomycetota bacterium]|nr:hypothetical protein [Planctomycetota bacterium]